MRTFEFSFSPEKSIDLMLINGNGDQVSIKCASDIQLTADDLQLFGEMCISIAEKMRLDHELRNSCPECGGMLAHHNYCSMFVKRNGEV